MLDRAMPEQLHPPEMDLPQEQNPQKQHNIHPMKKLEQASNIARTAVPWSNEESKLLVELRESGLTWKEIATRFTNRTLNACQFRWKRISLNGGIHFDENDVEEESNKSESRYEGGGEESKAKQATPDDIAANANVDNRTSTVAIATTSPTSNDTRSYHGEVESSLSGKKEQKNEEGSLGRSKRARQEETAEDRPYFKRLRSATRNSRGISNLLNNDLSETSSDKVHNVPVKYNAKTEQDTFEPAQRVAISKEGDRESHSVDKSVNEKPKVQRDSEKGMRRSSRVLKLEELVDNNESLPNSQSCEREH